MVTHRHYQVYDNGTPIRNVWGWYLFGIIPLYVKIHYLQRTEPTLWDIFGT